MTEPCTLFADGHVCGTPSVGRYLPGWRCDAHRPSVMAGHPEPARVGSKPAPAPERVRITYGSATTDPLGREGQGWHTSKQSRLPTRDKTTREDLD